MQLAVSLNAAFGCSAGVPLGAAEAQLNKLSHEITIAQTREIAFVRQWQPKHAP